MSKTRSKDKNVDKSQNENSESFKDKSKKSHKSNKSSSKSRLSSVKESSKKSTSNIQETPEERELCSDKNDRLVKQNEETPTDKVNTPVSFSFKKSAGKNLTRPDTFEDELTVVEEKKPSLQLRKLSPEPMKDVSPIKELESETKHKKKSKKSREKHKEKSSHRKSNEGSKKNKKSKSTSSKSSSQFVAASLVEYRSSEEELTELDSKVKKEKSIEETNDKFLSKVRKNGSGTAISKSHWDSDDSGFEIVTTASLSQHQTSSKELQPAKDIVANQEDVPNETAAKSSPTVAPEASGDDIKHKSRKRKRSSKEIVSKVEKRRKQARDSSSSSRKSSRSQSSHVSRKSRRHHKKSSRSYSSGSSLSPGSSSSSYYSRSSRSRRSSRTYDDEDSSHSRHRRRSRRSKYKHRRRSRYRRRSSSTSSESSFSSRSYRSTSYTSSSSRSPSTHSYSSYSSRSRSSRSSQHRYARTSALISRTALDSKHNGSVNNGDNGKKRRGRRRRGKRRKNLPFVKNGPAPAPQVPVINTTDVIKPSLSAPIRLTPNKKTGVLIHSNNIVRRIADSAFNKVLGTKDKGKDVNDTYGPGLPPQKSNAIVDDSCVSMEEEENESDHESPKKSTYIGPQVPAEIAEKLGLNKGPNKRTMHKASVNTHLDPSTSKSFQPAEDDPYFKDLQEAARQHAAAAQQGTVPQPIVTQTHQQQSIEAVNLAALQQQQNIAAAQFLQQQQYYAAMALNQHNPMAAALLTANPTVNSLLEASILSHQQQQQQALATLALAQHKAQFVALAAYQQQQQHNAQEQIRMLALTRLLQQQQQQQQQSLADVSSTSVSTPCENSSHTATSAHTAHQLAQQQLQRQLLGELLKQQQLQQNTIQAPVQNASGSLTTQANPVAISQMPQSFSQTITLEAKDETVSRSPQTVQPLSTANEEDAMIPAVKIEKREEPLSVSEPLVAVNELGTDLRPNSSSPQNQMSQTMDPNVQQQLLQQQQQLLAIQRLILPQQQATSLRQTLIGSSLQQVNSAVPATIPQTMASISGNQSNTNLASFLLQQQQAAANSHVLNQAAILRRLATMSSQPRMP